MLDMSTVAPMSKDKTMAPIVIQLVGWRIRVELGVPSFLGHQGVDDRIQSACGKTKSSQGDE